MVTSMKNLRPWYTRPLTINASPIQTFSVSNQLHNELKKDLPAGKAGFRLERLILAYAQALVVPLLFLLMLPVAYLTNVLFAVYIPMLIPLVLRVFKIQLRNRHAKIHLEK